MRVFDDCSELRDLHKTSTYVPSYGTDFWGIGIAYQNLTEYCKESLALAVTVISPVQRRIIRLIIHNLNSKGRGLHTV